MADNDHGTPSATETPASYRTGPPFGQYERKKRGTVLVVLVGHAGTSWPTLHLRRVSGNDGASDKRSGYRSSTL